MTQQASKPEIISSDLQQHLKFLGQTRDEQIEKNQALLKFIQSLLDKKLSQSEIQEAEKLFDNFKQIVDDNRTRKLFDEKK